MPVLKDEKILNVDGFAPLDLADSLRNRAQLFIASRQWSTTEVFYGDQAEDTEEGTDLGWSFCFNLGLDHIRGSKGKWRDDIGALVGHLQEIFAETGREILIEVRYRSKPWHSEHIAYVDDQTPDLDTICGMIERVC
jgi:hypothetical protein